MKDEVLRVLFEAIVAKWVFFLADVIIWQPSPPCHHITNPLIQFGIICQLKIPKV